MKSINDTSVIKTVEMLALLLVKEYTEDAVLSNLITQLNKLNLSASVPAK